VADADSWRRVRDRGVAYVIAGAGGNPKLVWLVFYTATGGLEFVIQAWLLARRRRGLTTRSADPEHKLTSAGLTVDSPSPEPHTAGVAEPRRTCAGTPENAFVRE
jgi:hypothetical protein